jgi:hypothetical protein
MAAFTLGTRSGLMEVDFRHVAQRLGGRGPLRHRRLFAGDVENVANGLFFSVHWPPRVLPGRARSKIQRVLARFHDVIKSPEREGLRELYNRATELIPEELANDELLPAAEGPVLDSEPVFESFDLHTDSELNELNNDLRDAANHICLAFSVGRRVLFLGDLGPSALDSVVRDLIKAGRVNYRHIVAAHHGTSWHDRLLNLRSRYVAVSVGDRLWRHVAPTLGRLGKSIHMTRLQGDLVFR